MDIPKPSKGRPHQLSLRLSEEEKQQLDWAVAKLKKKWGKANTREALRAALQLLYAELKREEETVGPSPPARQ